MTIGPKFKAYLEGTAKWYHFWDPRSGFVGGALFVAYFTSLYLLLR